MVSTASLAEMDLLKTAAVSELIDSQAKPDDELLLALAEKILVHYGRDNAMTAAIEDMTSKGELVLREKTQRLERLVPQCHESLDDVGKAGVDLLVRFIAGVNWSRNQMIPLNPLQQNMILSLAWRFIE